MVGRRFDTIRTSVLYSHPFGTNRCSYCECPVPSESCGGVYRAAGGPGGSQPTEGKWGYRMVFAIMLGLMIGAAGVLLVQQWARDSLSTPGAPALPKQQFPRLAPPRLPAAPELRIRRAA